jgi:hypothetical protein
VATILAALVWSFEVEPDRLVVRRERLALPGWPAALEGLRLVALADIHGGAPHVDTAKLQELAAVVNAERPDLVVLLGDFVIRGILRGRFMEPHAVARELAGIRGPLGVVAVLGNHDWWHDGRAVRSALEAAGIPVLENEGQRIARGGAGLWLAGLADPWTRDPDLAAAMEGVSAADAVVVLVHNPDVFPGIPARVALTLAGHPHGGQVRLPLLGAPVVPSRYGQRYAQGHVVEEGRHLFVTPGVGTSIVPVRFRVPPEVSVLTLAAAPH